MVDLPGPGPDAPALAQRLLRLAMGPGLMILARIGGAMAGLVLTMLLTRSMGAAPAGEVATATAIAMVLALFCSLNLEAGAVRFMVQDIARGNFAAAAGYVRFGRFFVALVGAGVLIAATGWFWLAGGGVSLPILIAIIAAPLLGWQRFGAGMAMGFSRPVLSVIPRTLLRPLILAGLVGAWIGLIGTPDPAVVMALLVVTTLATTIWQAAMLQPSLSRLAQDRGAVPPDTAGWRDWLRIGATLGLNVLFVEYSVYLTLLAAAPVLSPAETAYLDVLLKLVAFLRYAQVAIGQYYSPAMSRALARDDGRALGRLLAISGLLRAGVALAGVTALVLAGPLVLALFGAEFGALHALLIWLSLDAVLVALFGPGTLIVGLSRKPHATLLVLAATLAVLLAGVPVAGALWGLPGVAGAVLASRLIWTSGAAWQAWRLTGHDVTLGAVPRWWRARMAGGLAGHPAGTDRAPRPPGGPRDV